MSSKLVKVRADEDVDRWVNPRQIVQIHSVGDETWEVRLTDGKGFKVKQAGLDALTK